MEIVGFAFEKNVSERVLNQLKLDQKHVLKSDKEMIQSFVNDLFTGIPKITLP